jgi:hypothetical protein
MALGPDDADFTCLVTFGQGVSPSSADGGGADAQMTGTAFDVYLSSWNLPSAAVVSGLEAARTWRRSTLA